MKRFTASIPGCLPLLVLAGALAFAVVPRATAAAPAQDRTLIVLSTTDLKGKTGPCGCHIPKGGLARIASVADSLRASTRNVLLVTNGGFFPDSAGFQPVATFLSNLLVVIGTDAVGLSERDLRFGRGFLLATAKQSRLPLVCANVFDRATKQPLVDPWRIVRTGTVTVGVFGLASDSADYGAARDSLTLENPAAAAKRAVAELRAKGATVIVLLSSLGQAGSEDLVAAVEGIDVVIAGHDVPLVQMGRRIGHTLACYGGEQGEYIGRTVLTLDESSRVENSESETFMLGAEVGDQPRVLSMVKAFEDHWSDQLRRRRQAAK
jgi:2',3'-cyclic-nucleotide 2'-phosphodiesterase (5'-nucleotidase family)